MNVLPLVSAFILLFAIGSYSFIHSLRAVSQEKFHYHGALAVERAYADKIQVEFYLKQKKEPSTSKEKKGKKKTQKKKDITFTSDRDKINECEGAKLDIKGLFAEKENPQLEKIALTLLKELYKNTPIYKPDLEKEILSILIQTGKLNPSIASFEELLTKVPDASASLFYKLIKGTQIYQLKRPEQGYPPLSDFFSISSKTKKPINFYKASRSVLNAVFGENLTEQIIAEEKRKWDIDRKIKYLTQKELMAFFSKCNINYAEYDPLLYFSKASKKPSQETVKANGTEFQIRI